jgi:hypothetical protein
VGAARQAEHASRPRCAGPSGCLAVLAFRGVSLELAALRQERALIRERLRSSAAQRGRLARSAYRALAYGEALVEPVEGEQAEGDGGEEGGGG